MYVVNEKYMSGLSAFVLIGIMKKANGQYAMGGKMFSSYRTVFELAQGL